MGGERKEQRGVEGGETLIRRKKYSFHKKRKFKQKIQN